MKKHTGDDLITEFLRSLPTNDERDDARCFLVGYFTGFVPKKHVTAAIRCCTEMLEKHKTWKGEQA